MARDQIEYCGGCAHYQKCKVLSDKGKLYHCLAQKEKKNA